MATFLDNLNIIETAVYGKEMRPAIKEALLQSKEYADSVVTKIETLNKRVDALSSSGGGGEIPDNPDDPADGDTATSTGFFVSGTAFSIISAVAVNTTVSGEAIEI